MAEKQVKDYEKFVVRFPDGMRDVVAERAKRNGRSMNSEIIDIISNAVSQPALAQEGIEFLLSLVDPNEVEKLSANERKRAKNLLVDAAAIMAQRLESESKDLRVLLYLASKDSPLNENKKAHLSVTQLLRC
ncbi:Arc family DNA-binding protein [Citrobacter amalonaticus]|nr:Arc family DNA-binding protein [Citrobacter amalonaticus]